MEAYLTFTPPQLPQMMTGEPLSYHLASLYPQLQVQDAPLRDVISAMAAYDAARAEYQARNEHFGEWMHWYKENPAQKDRVVTFVVEHSSHFEFARGALQILADALGRLIEAQGDNGDLGTIRTVLAAVETGSQVLARNLQQLQSAKPPGASRILPQKRSSASS